MYVWDETMQDYSSCGEAKALDLPPEDLDSCPATCCCVTWAFPVSL